MPSAVFLSTPSARRATIDTFDGEDKYQIFLSTPSARRATAIGANTNVFLIYFYPRPPRGGRQVEINKLELGKSISIHALREEGDKPTSLSMTRRNLFLSTPSARRATFFTPGSFGSVEAFLSTPSARRATDFPILPCLRLNISIHALREEGDLQRHLSPNQRYHFYPRPPRGGRQQKQRENPLLLSHYTPPCTNCKEVPVKQTAKSHRYLRKRLVFRCEASGKTMCAACSHWRGIKRSAHYPAQTPGAAQHARP